MSKNKKTEVINDKHILNKKKHIISIRRIKGNNIPITDIEAESLEDAKKYLELINKMDDIQFVIFNIDEIIVLSGEIKNKKIKYIHENNGNHYGHNKDKDKDKDKDDDDSYA
jgi:hypothetical protein